MIGHFQTGTMAKSEMEALAAELRKLYRHVED
jgi:hypothetical protein